MESQAILAASNGGFSPFFLFLNGAMPPGVSPLEPLWISAFANSWGFAGQEQIWRLPFRYFQTQAARGGAPIQKAKDKRHGVRRRSIRLILIPHGDPATH